MASLNKCMFIGNVGKDAEPCRYTQNGQPVTKFSIACNETFGGRDGSAKQERTEWVNIVIWGRQAELAAQYIRKGRQVYIEGRLQTDSWVDPQGVKHYKCEIVCSRFLLLGKRDESTPDLSENHDAEELGPPLE